MRERSLNLMVCSIFCCLVFNSSFCHIVEVEVEVEMNCDHVMLWIIITINYQDNLDNPLSCMDKDSYCVWIWGLVGGFFDLASRPGEHSPRPGEYPTVGPIWVDTCRSRVPDISAQPSPQPHPNLVPIPSFFPIVWMFILWILISTVTTFIISLTYPHPCLLYIYMCHGRTKIWLRLFK